MTTEAPAQLLFDRTMLSISKKELRTDLALKFAKQEMAGESTLSTKPSLPTSGATPAAHASASSSTGGASASLQEILSLQSRGHSPIIIVPAASRSRLTLLNAAKFLHEGQFEDSAALRSVERPAGPIEIEKTISGHKLRFRIFDDVSRFRKDDWRAVVAVFTDGKAWQYSGWPFRTEADMFGSLQAFNLRYTDDAVDPSVTSGRIKSLLVKRSTRHQDSSLMIEFWRILEASLNQPRHRKFSSSHKLP